MRSHSGHEIQFDRKGIFVSIRMRIVRFTPIDMRSCRYASAAIAVSSRADRSAPSMPTELREFISNETHSHALKLCGCVRRCKVARSLWPSSCTNRS